MNKHGKDPLYRKVNTLARGVFHRWGGDFKSSRSRHKREELQPRQGSMHAGRHRGLDYTPLFRFLLSRVGSDWSAVFSEAVARLDRPDPIFWMVARSDMDKRSRVLVGENTYWSGLFIDESGRLAIVDPGLRLEDMEPSCACCTHTFNGKPFVRPYRERGAAG